VAGVATDPASPAGSLWAIPIAVAGLVGVIGLAGMVTIGSVLRSPPGAVMNAFVLLMSMIFCSVGVRALRSPTTLRIAPSQGNDVWGKARYGPTQTATAAQGIRMGYTFIVIGVLMLPLGIFLGRLVH
jgi:hypothetical protein